VKPIEWTAAEREAVREASWRFFFATPEEQRDAILAALAPFVAERERQAAARALESARLAVKAEYENPPRLVLNKAEQAAWKIGMARAHAIVRRAARADREGSRP
jgi:hypothetical protein